MIHLERPAFRLRPLSGRVGSILIIIEPDYSQTRLHRSLEKKRGQVGKKYDRTFVTSWKIVLWDK